MDPILDAALPKNRSARSRVIIGLALWATILTVWAIVVAMTNGLPLLGAVAWASDVDKKVEQAIQPIKTEVSQLKNELAQNTRVSNSLLASVTSSQIRATYARLCKEKSDGERDRLSGDFDRYLAEYPNYTNGARFPIESLRCGGT